MKRLLIVVRSGKKIAFGSARRKLVPILLLISALLAAAAVSLALNQHLGPGCPLIGQDCT
jgi:hypothetical protein